MPKKPHSGLPCPNFGSKISEEFELDEKIESTIL